MKKTILWFAPIMLATLLLVACGGDTVEEVTQVNQMGMEVVSKVSELPKCTKNIEGEQAFVKGETSARICVDGKWFATVQEAKKDTVYLDGGDLSCTTKQLKDKSGVKIICNGDSIGVVYNGKDGTQGIQDEQGIQGEKGDSGAAGKDGVNGTDGSDGKDGAGCSIKEVGELSVRVICGNDSTDLYVEKTADTTMQDTVVLDSEKVAVSLDEVSGVTQKGPFLSGSRVLIREMSDGRTLSQTGNSFNGKILNDKGEFKVKARMLVSQYVMLEASGYYRNEITGENSNSELTLFAITNVNDRNIVNVNLLTHLEYERVVYLVTQKKMKVEAAKKQAQKEVLGLLNIDATDFSNSEDLNIAGASDEDGALLAFSIILQGDRSVSQLSELLQKIATDMEEDGVWNNAAMRSSLADWAAEIERSGRMTTIRENVKAWELSSIVPNFERHVHHFWTTEYGLSECADGNQGEILQNTNELSTIKGQYFICSDAIWRPASIIEYDTYGWSAGADGDSRHGDVIADNCYVYEDSAWRGGNANDCSLGLRGCTALRQDTVGKGSDDVWHICDAKSWRNATTYEKDTFGWRDSTDGAIKKGDVTDSIYVFDETAWRTASDVEAKLGGCVATIADSVGKVGSIYYICKSRNWVNATVLEYDTYRWTAGKDGDSRIGRINAGNCYVYENDAWRSGNTNDCTLGLRGCTALRQDTVGNGSDNEWHICDAKGWRNATNIEKDTATWGPGSFGGEVRAGQINTSIYYIYEANNKVWRTATTLEKDTYDYTNNKDWSAGADGEIKKGSVTDSIYVYDATAWRIADDIEKVLGGCVATIADSVGKVGSTYYICTPRKWVVATVLQYDTYKKSCTEFGQIVHGNVNQNYAYFCYGEYWKLFYGNETKVYGKLVDDRDGKIYRTIEIGEQIWMAENLNYSGGIESSDLEGWCYNNEPENCEKYGRLYASTYNLSVSVSDLYGSYEEYESDLTCSLYPANAQGFCPNGWRLPNVEDWEELYAFAEGDYSSIQAKGFDNWYNATDKYGFSALPAGSKYVNESFFYSLGEIGAFITYPETTTDVGSDWWSLGERCQFHINSALGNGYSVRCIKDDE